MPWQYSPYFIPLAFAGTLAAIGFSRRSVRGAGPFALYLAAATVWILGYAGEFASADLAGLLPLAFVTAYLARPVSPVELDLMPFTFVFTGLAVMVLLLRNPLFDPMPIAYSRVVDSMADGVVVLDPDLQVAAAEVLPCVGDLVAKAACSRGGRAVPARLKVGGVPCHFELRCQPIEGRR